MTLLAELRTLFAPVLSSFVPEPGKLRDYLGMIKPAANAQHGDYQANFAMPLAKIAGKKPTELARAIIEAVPENDLIASLAVAGPGFINITLQPAALAKRVLEMARDEHLGITPPADPLTYIIDLSGPNVAKPLHVGHLRSTIIGDALVRILRYCGHNVVSDNHLGDWGTQFGILLYGYKHHRDDAAFATDPVRELARLYIHVRSLFVQKSDEDDDDATTTDDPVKEACRQETAKLHAGDLENVTLWQQFMPACLAMLEPIYKRLDIHIDHALGESFYNPMLPDVVEDLLAKGLAVESHGAVVVPNAKGLIPQTPDEMEKEEPPALIRKRDGAFTYTTTDLATIRYRVETWKPQVMLYVVDARQSLHFKTLFANARRWGYEHVTFEHIKFGSILGKDKKPFQTRKGDTVELAVLLDEAVQLGLQEYEASVAKRRTLGRSVPDLSDEEKQAIAEAVGIGAVKYADLGQNRTSDYVYDPDKMLATEGNTATYMQYAYARCQAILRDSDTDPAQLSTISTLVIGEPQERALAVQLLRFGEALDSAVAEYMPHHLTSYLWDLAKSFSTFYDACKVLKAEDPEVRQSRLLLVELTGRVIRQTLYLLGIRTVERM